MLMNLTGHFMVAGSPPNVGGLITVHTPDKKLHGILTYTLLAH